jgi:hypothetical protein
MNFAISKESAVRNVRRQLAPWNIYDVTFVGCEVREFKGTKDPNVTYQVLDIKFENEDGYFTVTRFFPKQGDDVRRKLPNKKGGEREVASNFEELMNIVKQTAEVLTPEGFKKMSELSSKFRSFDDVAKALIAITDKVKGTKTKIKLVGRTRDNRVVAEIPTITSVFDGVATITDNYIGNKLFFTPYEEGKRNEYLKGTPTDMEKVPAMDPLMAVAEEAPAEEELDLESLL